MGCRYLLLGFGIVYAYKKQVQGSRRVGFVIKVTFPKWKSWLSSLNGKYSWTKLESLGKWLKHLCKHLIIEWFSSLKAFKEILCKILEDWIIRFITKWPKFQVCDAIFISLKLLAQKWSLQVLENFGKLETLYKTFILTTLPKSNWN